MSIAKKYDVLCEYSDRNLEDCTTQLLGDKIHVKSIAPLDALYFDCVTKLKLRITAISPDKTMVLLKEIKDTIL